MSPPFFASISSDIFFIASIASNGSHVYSALRFSCATCASLNCASSFARSVGNGSFLSATNFFDDSISAGVSEAPNNAFLCCACGQNSIVSICCILVSFSLWNHIVFLNDLRVFDIVPGS